MLVARDSVDKPVKATDVLLTQSARTFYCPECGEKVFVKRPALKVHHFSHFPSLPGTKSIRSCREAEPETEWHLCWKARFPADEIEVKVANRRCDALNGFFAFEFQHSSITPYEIEVRTRDLLKVTKKVVWVLDCSSWTKVGQSGDLSLLEVRKGFQVKAAVELTRWGGLKDRLRKDLHRDGLMVYLHIGDALYMPVKKGRSGGMEVLLAREYGLPQFMDFYHIGTGRASGG